MDENGKFGGRKMLEETYNLQGISGFKIRGYIAGKEYVRSGSSN